MRIANERERERRAASLIFRVLATEIGQDWSSGVVIPAKK